MSKQGKFKKSPNGLIFKKAASDLEALRKTCKTLHKKGSVTTEDAQMVYVKVKLLAEDIQKVSFPVSATG
jgi:uncharacterized protein YoxC